MASLASNSKLLIINSSKWPRAIIHSLTFQLCNTNLLVGMTTHINRALLLHRGEENISVIVAPIPKQGYDLTQTGGPREMAEMFLSKTVAPEGSNKTA